MTNRPDLSTVRATLRRASRRTQRVPWWAVIMALIFIVAAIEIAGSARYQDILRQLIDDPHLTTDDRFDVAYRVDVEVVAIQEQYTVLLADGERIDINGAQVETFIEDGILECDRTANPDCLNASGTLVEFRMPLGPGATGDGTTLVTGVVRPGAFVPVVDLPDGGEASFDPDAVLERSEGTLACNAIIDPDCEDLEGEIVTFERPYELVNGLVAWDGYVIRHPDGFEQPVRGRFLSDIETVPCREDTPCYEGEVTLATLQDRIIGVEIERDSDQVTVRTVDEQVIDIERENIINIDTGLVMCDRQANPRCQDFEGTIIERSGQTYSGLLTLENDRSYRLIPDGDDAAIEVRKQDVISEERSPEGCRYDDGDDEPCDIVVQEQDNVVAGRIVNDDDTGIAVQTVAPVFITLNRDDIDEDASNRTPKVCALNNLRGCNAGIWLTLLVTIVSYTLALILGLFVGLMRVSSNPILFHLSTVYVELIRGTPLLVLLLFFAFVVGPALRDSQILSPFYDLLNEIEVAVLGQETFLSEAILGLSIGYAAFLAEVFRAGIQSIGKGQMEAARSLGMSYPQAMRTVILPQAIRVVLPPLGNDFIAMLKDSALIAVLALPDLLQSGRLYVSRTFQTTPVYIMVALLYILLTLGLSFVVRTIEKRFKIP